MNKLDLIGQIADLKELDYRNTLAIASIIELLIDKGIINRSDIASKAYELENATLDEINQRHADKNKSSRINLTQ
ncbi:MAG: hypothetical protein ACOZCL_10590 [Bacillota bacterium]